MGILSIAHIIHCQDKQQCFLISFIWTDSRCLLSEGILVRIRFADQTIRVPLGFVSGAQPRLKSRCFKQWIWSHIKEADHKKASQQSNFGRPSDTQEIQTMFNYMARSTTCALSHQGRSSPRKYRTLENRKAGIAVRKPSRSERPPRR